MNKPEQKDIEEITSGKKSIPLKWVFLAILVFAVFYHAALLFSNR